MKSLKKFTAIVIAFILTFSVLTVVSSAVGAGADVVSVQVPSYGADDLTYSPTAETEPSKDIGDFIDDDILNGMAQGSKWSIAAGFDLSNFFRKAMKAFIELFDHVNNLLFPAK